MNRFFWWVVAFACASAPFVSFAQSVGTIRQVHGNVISRKADGSSIPLKAGDQIRPGDVVEAGPGSEALLATNDGGAIAIRPTALIDFKKYSTDENSQPGVVIRLMRGGLRILTGWVGKAHRDQWRLETPTATIGIRGTDYEPYVIDASMAASAGEKEGTYGFVRSGGIAISNPYGEVPVAPGRVGYSPAPMKTRALATALRPVLLDRVPGFFQAPRVVDRLFEQMASSDSAVSKACDAVAIGSGWIKALDETLVARDAKAFLGMFADDIVVVVRAPKASDASNDTVIPVADFQASTRQSFADLQKYWFERKGVASAAIDAACSTVRVESFVREGGLMGGAPYESSATEIYELKSISGSWRAMRAITIAH